MRASTRHINIDGSSGSPNLAVLSFEAPSDGPCVVITANVHGDEVTGLVAAQRLCAVLESGLRRGRVVLFPSLNPGGLAANTRGVPADGADLTRSFPGRRRGRASERLADVIWTEVTREKPDVVIDLHADSAASIPYALLDRAVRPGTVARRELTRRLGELGAATGLTVVNDYPEDLYLRYGLDRSLAGALVNKATIPAITVEAGPRRRIDPVSVQAAVGAVCGVLASLGVIDGPAEPHPTRVDGVSWRREGAPRTQLTGWFDAVLEPGDLFARGQVLGHVRHVDGRVLEAVTASAAGLVLSWAEATWATAGSVVGTIAVKER